MFTAKAKDNYKRKTLVLRRLKNKSTEQQEQQKKMNVLDNCTWHMTT